MRKSFYSSDDIKNIFYPNLYNIINGIYPKFYSDDEYIKLINSTLLNPSYAANFLYLIYGQPDSIFDYPKNVEIESLLDLFSMSNSIEPKIFKAWYRQPNHNVDIFLAIKRFLIDGYLYVNIVKNTLNNSLKEIFKICPGKSTVFLIDGDNLYYHIGPLFKILGPEEYAINFFRSNNISPIYSGYLSLYNKYTKNKGNINTIESYNSRKDAADVELTTCMTFLKAYQISHKDIFEVGNYYIVTGDEYSHELVITSNIFYEKSDYVFRLNSQLIDFTKNISRNMQSPWTINPSHFSIKDFGELNPRLITDKIRPSLGVFDNQNNINNLILSDNPSTKDPINTMWVINFIKSIVDLPTLPDNEYSDVLNLLQRIDIYSYKDLITELSLPKYNNTKFELIEKYLVLIGAKYFTKAEMLKYFFSTQFKFFNALRALYNNNSLTPDIAVYLDGNIVITGNILDQFLKLDIDNRDIFNLFFNITNIKDVYTKHIDVLWCLSIKNINSIGGNILKSEEIKINSLSFEL